MYTFAFIIGALLTSSADTTTTCSSAHDDDASAAACFGWCSPLFAAEHCSWCKVCKAAHHMDAFALYVADNCAIAPHSAKVVLGAQLHPPAVVV